MNSFKIRINNLYTEVDEKIHQQYTIDVIEDVMSRVKTLSEKTENSRKEIGYASYRVNMLLIVFNPAYELDIAILKNLAEILDEWFKSFKA